MLIVSNQIQNRMLRTFLQVHPTLGKRMFALRIKLAVLFVILSAVLFIGKAAKSDVITAFPVNDIGNGTWMLLKEKWKEAGELLTEPDDLQGAFYLAFHESKNRKQPERDNFRFKLINFYFRYMNFAEKGFDRSIEQIKRLADEYEAILERGDYPADKTLDFSNFDIIDEITQFKYWPAHEIPNQTRERIFNALKTNPDNVPAIIAFLTLLQVKEADPEDRERGIALLTGPFGKLTYARQICRKNGVVCSKTGRRIVESAHRLAPTDHQRAALLYHLMPDEHADLDRRNSDDFAHAIYDRMRRVYETYPATEFATRARIEAIRTVTDARGPEAGLKLARELRLAYPDHTDGFDQAMFAVSTTFFRAGKYKQSEAILLELFAIEPKTSLSSRAALGLSEVYAKLEDHDEKLRWLITCAELKYTEPTGRGIMDTDSTQSVAVQRIAHEYERREAWDLAVKYWEMYKPRSFCGTCIGQMYGVKNKHLMKCNRLAGNYKWVVRELFARIMRQKDDATETLVQLYHLYRDADQVDDLRTLVNDCHKREIHLCEKHGIDWETFRKKPIYEQINQTLDRLTELDAMAAKGEFEKLRVIRDQDEKHDWERAAAASAIAHASETDTPDDSSNRPQPGSLPTTIN